MAKSARRTADPPAVEPTAGAAAAPWKSRWRWLISAAVLVHVSAVFIAPFTFATSSAPGVASPLAVAVMDALRPYIDLAYLNHGYFFFAPNPGPSHLVRAELQFADDRPDETYTFPDRNRHWPRLLYHRHFMLSESLNAAFVPPEPPAEIAGDQEQLAVWQARRERYEALWNSYRTHLETAFDAQRVELTRVEHRPPSMYEIAVERKRLTDPSFYQDLPEVLAAEPPSAPIGPQRARPPLPLPPYAPTPNLEPLEEVAP